jgi:hypothetical protein
MLTEANAPAVSEVTIRPGGCGGCTLCCKVMGVTSLAKPANVWCPHCQTGVGCGIYESRPVECINFICGFLSSPDLPEEWRPVVSKLIIDTQTLPGTMLVLVDPARPDAWRRQPYYAALKAWARAALANQSRVIVRVGRRNIVILPDCAVDLGPMQSDEAIVVLSAMGQSRGSPGYQVYVAKSDVWEKVALEVRQGKRIPTPAEGFRAGRRLD